LKTRLYQTIAPIHGYLTTAIALLLPVSKKMVPPIIGLWVIASFFLFAERRRQISAGETKAGDGFSVFGLIALYYLFNFFWFGWSDDTQAAQFNMEIKLSLLLFPVIWAYQPNIQIRQRFNVLLAFVWGCLLFTGISLARAGWIFYDTGDVGAFYYDKLAWFFHPTYLATYMAFGLVVLGRMYSRHMFALGKPWVHHITAALLVLHIALLSSKAGYLCALLALLLVTLLLLRRKRSLQGLVYLLLNGALFAGVVLFSPNAQRRLEEVTTLNQAANNDGQEVKANSSSGGRVVAWETALKVMVEQPMGVGTGDVTNVLKEHYLEDGESYAYKKELNPHNQFLQSGVEFGWLGMI
jgi:O-antigen ligase